MSSEYWRERFQAVEDMQNKTARDAVQSITPSFDRAQARIQKELNDWYVRFANNNQISMVEARKLLNTRELKEFRWDVEEYIKYGRQNAIDPQWMKELENASARFHISRLEALKVRVQNAAEVAFGNEIDQIDRMAARAYTDGYYRTAFEIQRGLGIGWDIGQIDQKRLDAILSKPWTADNKTFSNRVWERKASMISNLHDQMTRMCILGKSPDEAIKAMEQYVSKDVKNAKSAAGRLVMTESAYFGSVAQKDCFNDLDVEKFEIIATLDSHTSQICQDLDGKVVDMKDFEAGVTAPPFHVWCRSCTAPWFEDEDGMRAARDADGNTYYVPSSMKYKDWKNSFVDGGSKKGLAPVVDIDDLQKQLDGKKVELEDLKKQLDRVNDDLDEWRVGDRNPFYKSFKSMSDDEYQKHVDALKKQNQDLTDEINRLGEDMDRYYKRPDRGTPERDAWNKWRDENNIDITELNNAYYKAYDDRSAVRDKLNDALGFDNWKSKFGGKTEQDFVDEISDIVFKQQDVQKQIDELTEQLQYALERQSQLAFDARDLAEIRDEIIKKHESILRGDVQKKEFADIIDGLDKERANLYDKMADNFGASDYHRQRAGWYKPLDRRVEMNLEKNVWEKNAGRSLNSAWKTKFHEEMHQLDHILATRKSDFSALLNGNGHNKWAFTRTDTVIGKKMIEAIDDDVIGLINKAVDWDNTVNGVAGKYVKTLDRIPNDAKASVIKYLKSTYPTSKDRALIDTVTDAVGLTTKGKIHPYQHGFWGHDFTYTKGHGKDGATSEVWANLGGFLLKGDTEALEAVKAVMPRTVSVYEDVFKDVLEYAKSNGLSYER